MSYFVFPILLFTISIGGRDSCFYSYQFLPMGAWNRLRYFIVAFPEPSV